MKKTTKRAAFTLIEISIVLVIIGIILASVMKGRDLIKSSQIKEYNQVFVSQWETIANSYFSRMAGVLADGDVNGGRTGWGITIPNGFMDGNINNTTEYANVKAKLAAAGINIDDLIKSDTGNPFERSADGEFTGKTITEITFSNYILNGSRRNYLVFNNVPGDVAQAIDTMKDGSPNGQSGSVIALSNTDYRNNNNHPGTEVNGTVEVWDATALQAMAIALEH